MEDKYEDDYIKEKELKAHSKYLSMEEMEIIFNQIKKSICHIECKDNGHGIVFFIMSHGMNGII